jgi:hypothetical protein
LRGRTAALCLLGFAAACGAPRVNLPSGDGTPFPESTAAYDEAIAECRGARTISASLALSGRAGATKLSARVDAGFAEPDRLRLEGYPRVSFGGRPFFVLVARDGQASLVLTRSGGVLQGAPPAAILEALTGVALDPAQLRAVISGCGLGAAQAGSGRAFQNGWAAIEAGDTTVFLRQLEGRWRVAALRRPPLTIEYADFVSGRPSTVRLRTAAAAGSVAADIRLRLSQVEIDVPLADHVFEVDPPRDAVPITLEELRRAGPLG